MKTTLKKRAAAGLMAALLAACACAAAEQAPLLVETPDGYEEGAPLPVYHALKRSQKQAGFFDKVDLKWFNTSGQLSYENGSKRARYDHFVFNDEARLDIDVNLVAYTEYDGTEMIIDAEDPDNPRGPYPRESFAGSIGSLADGAYYYAKYDEGAPKLKLERTELKGVTLKEAKTQMEGLLEKLGVTGYAPAVMLDMSVERIHTLGAYEEKSRGKNKYQSTGWWDFSQADEADEGFYLRYQKMLNGVPVGEIDGDGFYATAFVDAGGVRSFSLLDGYAQGDVYDTPVKLLTAAEAFRRFGEGNARREKDGIGRPTATGARLMYAPARARSKKDGMVFEPVWYIQYDWMDVTQPCDGWAWYSAVDGRLIADCYS